MPPPADELHLRALAFEHYFGAGAAWAAGWTSIESNAAIDSHDTGSFVASWQLGIDAPRYSPISAALDQRTSPPRALKYQVTGVGRFSRVDAVGLWEAHLHRLLDDSLRDVALLGFSVWQHPIRVNEAGKHVVESVERWPLAAVIYTPTPFLGGSPGYYAVTREGYIKLPKPGTTDGHWTVLGEGDTPHLKGAIRALSTSYVAGQHGERDRASLSATTGRAAPIAELPAGKDGAIITAEDEIGQSVGRVVAGLGRARVGAVVPNGTKITAFQITTSEAALFSVNLADRIKLVALALLGQSGTLVAGDGGVYTAPVFADVPESLVRRDVKVIETAANGLFAVLTMLNYGSSAPAPTLCGPLADRDEEERLTAQALRFEAFHRALSAERANGFEPDEARVRELAVLYRVPPPRFPPAKAA